MENGFGDACQENVIKDMVTQRPPHGELPNDNGVRVPYDDVLAFVAQLFENYVSPPAARQVASSLVEADARGVPSHGVMLAPMYLERIANGSVSRHERPETVHDGGGFVLLDARHSLGQLSSDVAVEHVLQRAGEFGIALVAVRHAFHFGAAFRYSEAIARHGLIGVALSNTRPLMPAVGGAEAVVGNNPVAVSVPGLDDVKFTLDMALSEAALGKIRLAAASGRPIPSTWATDADGIPTEDPAAAIAGLLLPIGGPKGFGLALVVDVLTGVLSGGAIASEIQGLYADTGRPNDVSHTFIAIDVRSVEDFGPRVERLATAVVKSKRRAGIERLYLPGEIERDAAANARRQGVMMDASTIAGLQAAASAHGVDARALVRLVPKSISKERR